MQDISVELEAPLSDIVERQENVVMSLAQLDALLDHYRDNLPPRLVHFLERRSYHKALAFLRDGDTGHHP